MHHKGTLTVGNAAGRPYHIQCTCGSAGDFQQEAQAATWFSAHVSRIGPTETWQLHIPGANKPAAKTAPPPAPPAPKMAVAKTSTQEVKK